MAKVYVYTYVDTEFGNIKVNITDAPNGTGNATTVDCDITLQVAYKTSNSSGTQNTTINIPAHSTGGSEAVFNAISIYSSIGLPVTCGNDEIYYQSEQTEVDGYVRVHYNGSYLKAEMFDSETGGSNIVSDCDIIVSYDFVLEDSSIVSRSVTIVSGQTEVIDYYTAEQYQNVQISPTSCEGNTIHLIVFPYTPPPPNNVGWNTKYKMSFNDHFSHLWTVELKYEGYSGNVTELQAGGTPLIIKKTPQGSDDKYTPFVKTSCEINIVSKVDFVKNNFNDFFLDNYECKIVIKDNNSGYIWEGWYISQYLEYKEIDRIQYISMKGVDGLSISENKSFYDIYDSSFGETKLKEILFRSIAAAYDGDTFTPANNYKFKVVNSIKFSLSDTSILEAKYLIDNAFDFSSLKSKNFNDFLSDFLESLGMRVFYENGYYWVIRIGDIENDTIEVHDYRYDENGVHHDGSNNVDLSKSIPEDINVVNNPINVSIDKFYKAVRHNVPLEYRELLKYPRFGASLPYDNWNYSGDGSFLVIEQSEPTYQREGIDKKMTLNGGDQDDYVVQILETGDLSKEPPWFMSPIKIKMKIDVSKMASDEKQRKISWKLRASKLQGSPSNYSDWDGQKWGPFNNSTWLFAESSDNSYVNIDIVIPPPVFWFNLGYASWFEELRLFIRRHSGNNNDFSVDFITVGLGQAIAQYETLIEDAALFDQKYKKVSFIVSKDTGSLTKEMESIFISKDAEDTNNIDKFSRRFLDGRFFCNDVDGVTSGSENKEINKLMCLSKLRQLSNRCASMQYKALVENLYLYNIINLQRYNCNMIMKDINDVKNSTHSLNTKEIYTGDKYVIDKYNIEREEELGDMIL